MNKIIAILGTIVILFNNTYLYEIMWDNATDDERKEFPVEVQAYACGMTVEEYSYFARVVQAESNGTTDWSDFEDKVLIACVILNRRDSSSFPNTIQGVLDQSGQFDTTYNGWCSTSYTDSSRWAVVEAQRRLAEGTVPSNLLYFNCIYYFNWAEPYCCEGGNYFSLG